MPTIDVLVERAYRHYPRGIETDDPRYQTSEEFRRLVCVREAAARRCQWAFYTVPDDWRVAMDPEVLPVLDALDAWRPFAARWKAEFPDLLLWDKSNPWHDACYQYSAPRPGYVQGSPDWHDPVVCAVSILAPVYVIYSYIPVPGTFTEIRYSNFPDHYQDRINKLSALTEEMFGFHRLGEDILLTPVPDAIPFSSNRPMNKTTLMHCLFAAYP